VSKPASEDVPIEGAVARDRWTALALWDFKGTEPGQLSFKKNDIITILEMDGDEWWTARITSGEEGDVPANYVKVMTDKKQFTVNENSVSSKIADLQNQLLLKTS